MTGFTLFATRIFGRDGVEYTGGVYRTCSVAVRGAKRECKAIQGGADWQICTWDQEQGFGEIICASDD